ncbi:nucleosomal histone kinase 1-like [Teleopsis dalmanni]|uniref:nucleosomal histone kinase 1-like n=1 Tax=Teleopsis dalmanni TaxID=139649 RepID=UPI0018CC7EBC|nr:nucleosomal histone kinase 1-like [Teleopsis dalmanni]XP_037947843.1 nucleosomal histone kinase 1-like [Teleopsis dalmanni]
MPRPQKQKKDGGVAVKKPAAKRNKLYAMPESIAEGTELTDLTKTRWRIGKSIGTGGFGEIYTAAKVGETNYDYVIKCEPHENGPLFVEMHFYMRNAKLEDLQKYKRTHGLKNLGMPYMLGNGSEELNGIKHRFIVIPRYGSDIEKHIKANGGRLPEGTIYRIALQMLDVYEFVHTCGYIHADLKAPNILLGYGKNGNSQAYLLDYGLASRFTTKEFKPDPKKMHNGTIEYTSRDAHQGVATMRSDLEILGYNLIEWMGAKLPWVQDKLLAAPAKVQKSKEDFFLNLDKSLSKLFPKGVSVPIAEYMKNVCKMEYNDRPDYDKFRKTFLNGLKTLKISNQGDLEFNLKTTTSKNEKQTTGKSRKNNRKDDSTILNTTDDVDYASEDDDTDVIFVKKKNPVKVAPTAKELKTINIKSGKEAPTNILPRKRNLTPSPSKHKISPKNVNTNTARTYSPNNKRTIISTRNTPNSSFSDSPISVPSRTPTPRKPIHHIPTAGTSNGQSSSLRPKGSTPISARANINLSPAISMTRSSARPGKTIINDNLTPNIKSSKTYEFNFELDVSVDANVVVNVKRKKKGIKTESTSTPRTNSDALKASEGSDSPATRVKIRKLADDGGSPRTPVVMLKKSKRVVSPR